MNRAVARATRRPSLPLLPIAIVLVPLLAGCPRAAETRGTAGTRIPPGCERDLSGDYVHASGAPFRYHGVDDGGTLVLALELGRDDGGMPEAGPVITLQRQRTGFVGVARARVFPAGGSGCLVDFPTEVTACERDRMTLRTARTAAVDETCAVTDAGAAPELADHVLVRAPPDGGTAL